ncbi:helix-turn-helix transcriptional regulator [Dyadobacter psychrotolerans]|nr:WYL domain-containing protein [Dyadobacter psychrotolerans]
MNSCSAAELVKFCEPIDPNINGRTVRADIQFLRDLGASIPKGNKHQKFYYKEAFSLINALEGIKYEETNEMVTYLNQLYHLAPKAALLDLDKVFLALERRVRATDAQGDPRLQFERTEYSGQNWIRVLYDYIVGRKTILLIYKPFERQPQERIILPIFLKEYNQRWFLIAYDAGRLAYQNFALDRIEDVKMSDKKLALDKMPDPATYFNNLIGVSLEGELTTVAVRVKKPRAFYIRTKPWHLSQTEVSETSEYIDFEWTVYTNRELKSKIFELGPDAEVLSPHF